MKRVLCNILGVLALLIGLNLHAATQINDTVALTAESQAQQTEVKFPKVIADMWVGGIVYQDYTARTTTGTVIETLTSVTIPANTVNQRGRGLKVTIWGTTAATANAKTVDIKLGSTTVYTTGAIAANAKTWKLTCYIHRTTGAAVGQSYGEGLFNDEVVTTQWAATTEDFSTALTLAIRATDATASGGTLLKGFQVEAF